MQPDRDIPDPRDAEIAELRAQLAEAQETLAAIRTGAVDGLVVTDLAGDHVFSLAGAEAPYRSLVEAIHEGALLLRTDGTVLYANRRFAEMTARPLEEMIGKAWSGYFVPADAPILDRMLSSHGGLPVRGEFMLQVGATGQLPVQVSLATAGDGSGQLCAAILTDLSQRRRAEEDLRRAYASLEHSFVERTAALRDSEQRFRLATRASRTMVYELDLDSLRVHALHGVADVLGFEAGEVDMTLRWWDERIHPEDLPRCQAARARMKGEPREETLRYRVRSRDGRELWVEDHSTPVLDATGQVGRLVGTIMDITARRRMEEELQASQERKFHAVFDGASDGILLVDLETRRFALANASFCRMLDYTPEELSRFRVEDLHPPADRSWILESFGQAIRTGDITSAPDLPMLRKDGSVFHASLGAAFVTLEGRSYIAAFFRDITERKRMEDAVRESEVRYRTLVEHLPLSVALTDNAARVIAANPAAARILGFERPEDGVGMSLPDFIAPEERDRVMGIFRDTMARGFSAPFEARCIRRDGSTFPAELSGVVVRDVLGRPTSLLALGVDLTERKAAQRALIESEARYRLLVENLPLAVIVADDSYRIVLANPAAVALTKADRTEDLLGRNAWDFVEPGGQADALVRAGLLARQGAVPPSERQFIRLDGTRVPVKARAVALRTADGKPAGVVAIAEDISDRKRMVAEALMRDAIWRIFLETDGLEAIYQRLADELTARLGFALATVEILDPARGEMVISGVSGTDGIARGSRVPVSQTLSAAVAGTQCSACYSRADLGVARLHAGLHHLGLKTVLCAPFRAGDQGAGVVMVADPAVREDAAAWLENLEMVAQTLSLEIGRRQAQEALQASESRFRVYVQQLTDGFFVFDEDGRFLEVNHRATAMYGYSREEFLRLRVSDLAPSSDWTGIAERLRLLEPGAPASQQGVNRRKDGGTFPVEARFGVFEIQGQRRYVALVSDLTERLAGQRELTRLFAAIEQAGEAIIITDGETRIEYVNRAFEIATGYTKAEAVGQTPRILRSGQHDAAFYLGLKESLIRHGVWRGRFINRHKQGRLFHEDAVISTIRDAEGRIINYVAAKHDVTRQVQMEAQLRQSQKLEAVGQLAGGMAHDFNNVLAAVMLNLGLLQMDPTLTDDVQQVLRDLDLELNRASTLTRQLLMFSRRSVLEIRPLDLNDMVTGLLRMLERLIREEISVEFRPGARLPAIAADGRLLEQVVMNLVINARDAIAKDGLIVLTTASASLSPEEVSENPQRRPGQFVLLTVSDTGCGMDEATVHKIFEPFFTTKEAGKGTGLGLATVHGIVAQHHGWVEVDSKAGLGSTFRVFLPATDQEATRPGTEATARPVPRGSETILVVEDEVRVRSAITQTLRTLGYRVQEAANGREAVKLWQTHGSEVGLLLTDMVMPEGMTGLELWERLRSCKPGLRAIISSGYSAEIVREGVADKPDIVYLPKPYSTTQLAEVVRHCLDQHL